MILSFSQLGRHGRLGNQLFQVASTMGLAEKYNAQAAFPVWPYEKYFDISLPHGPLQSRRVEEKFFHHYDWDLSGSCDLYGYMQSEKYFGSFQLKFRKEYIQKIRTNPVFKRRTICIQIRRGDYVGNDNYHQLTPVYYLDALTTHFPDWREYNLVFLSDDIEYCRVHFECLPNSYFSKSQSDIQDLMLASCCDHFIISNSSFGWWCAWLGEKKHSRIVHCGKLHAGPLAGKEIHDYYPERWTQHAGMDFRIPLQDVTFTIPVLYDHTDRQNNLELSVCLLQRDLDTQIIVCEQGGKKFQHMQQWVKYVQFPGGTFHRTRMLNDMAMLADTSFIVNYDCDVIIPPCQLWMAVQELRAGADMVFPFDGRFARMPRVPWFASLQKSLDIGIVRNQEFKGRVHGHNSVGGAVLFNKDSFIAGGMENERMVSFGPEDCERHDRMKTLGYDIRRVRGSLFHIDHFIGMNSSPKNPYFKANHRELEKIRSLGQEDLRSYVESWEWPKRYRQDKKILGSIHLAQMPEGDSSVQV